MDVGTVVRHRTWPGHPAGTVVRSEGPKIFVAWHNTCVEDELDQSEVEEWHDAPQALRDWRGGTLVIQPDGHRHVEPVAPLAEEHDREPRYPDLDVQLTGQDGNAFMVLGLVTKALRGHGVPDDEVDEFMQQATAGDYDHLLATCMRWVNVN